MMNFDDHRELKDYEVVATATECSIVGDEDEGYAVFVVYHNHSSRIFFARVDPMSGMLRVLGTWPYDSPRSYASAYGKAMHALLEKSVRF